MNAERWQRIKSLHADALELASEQREAWLRAECGDDDELFDEVRDMLAASERTDDAFLEPPTLRGSTGSTFVESGLLGDGAGPVFLGQYELVEELGRGGMGIVYLAREEQLDREVAVKVLPPSLTLTERQVRRFQEESVAAARLRHPHIVPIHSVGEQDGVRFFSMNYVPGHDLHTEVELQKSAELLGETRGTILPPFRSSEYIRAACELSASIAEALQFAHDAKVVHRDVKPHNILLDYEGHPQLVDFGMARDENLGRISQSGELGGTPYYMSPEQARAIEGRVDHRTDIYSLGVVLYELLTLSVPFAGRTSQEVIDKIAIRDAAPVRKKNPRVARDLETICHKAMSKEPRLRYPTAGEFAADLRRFLAHESIAARPPSVRQRTQRLVTRHPAKSTAAAVVLAGVLVGPPIASTYASDRLKSERLDSVRSVLALPDLADADPAELIFARGEMLELRERGGMSAAEEALVGEAEQRILEYATTIGSEGVERLEGSSDLHPLMRASQQLEGLVQVFQAWSLAPGDPQLMAFADLGYWSPKLTLVADGHDGGEVFLQTIDPVTGILGELDPIGPVPLELHPVPLGYFRVTVRDGDRWAEFDRVFSELREEIRIDADLRSVAETEEGMQLFASTEIPNSLGGFLGTDAPERFELPGFYLDTAEVTIGEYREFLDDPDVDVGPPRIWPEDGDRSLDDYPVIGVPYDDAVRYAEWAGKRLPTLWEWRLAARGVEGRLYPWGNDDSDGRSSACVLATSLKDAIQVDGVVRNELLIPLYTEVLAPAESVDPVRTELGLYHMLGNAGEWTSTMAISRDDEGSPSPMLRARAAMGGSFIHRATLDLDVFELGLVDLASEVYGLRCAKSAL